MSARTFHVDAFTAEPFAGNPAAVYVLDAPATDDWMRGIAAEMNLSETAFLVRTGDGYDLRWFTPTVEIDLCGHATLAAAHVLWTEGLFEGDPIRFSTRSGILVASRAGSRIALDFPADPPVAADVPGLEAALRARVVSAGRARIGVVAELESADAVRSNTPDFDAVAALGGEGVIVTARSDRDGIDFVSRYFAPNVGLPEDPVTGAAHCALAPYWAERFGREELTGYQASARGGTVGVKLRGDRVTLLGDAVTITRGALA